MKNLLALLAGVLAPTSAAMLGLALAVPAHADDAFLVCSSGHSGIATTVTSCPFAENVRHSYFAQGGPLITAYSPVTGQYYDMNCDPGYVARLNTGMTVPSVRCAGGEDAVVIVF